MCSSRPHEVLRCTARRPENIHLIKSSCRGKYGRALAHAALSTDAHGRAWIVPNDRTLTTREVARLFFAAAERGKEISRIPRFLLAALGLFNPVIREVGEMLYQKEEKYVVDGSLFRAKFGFTPTPLEEGIRRTLEWYTAGRRAGRA